jgi:Uma2 family endonuclease
LHRGRSQWAACDRRREKDGIDADGATTWKRKCLGRGVEADASFYIASTGKLHDRIHIDLESDPPPDLVVEIDITSECLPKFPIYAALGIPEIWQSDGTIFHLFKLSGNDYIEIPESECLPRIPPAIL